MAGSRKFDKRGSGPMFWLLLALLVFALYSASVAALTAEDCGEGAKQTWQILPPGWECSNRLSGYG